MSRKCEICGKQTTVGNNVSHSHNKTKRKIKANIQSSRAVINGKVVKIKVCTSCIKSGRFEKPAK